MVTSARLSFFPDVTEEVAGPHMARYGFTPVSRSASEVVFARDDQRVAFAYYVEDTPSPGVAVDVGVVADDQSERTIGLWRAIPPTDPARSYPEWRFDDPSSLKRALERVLAEVLDVYGPPVWNEPSRMARLLAERSAEAEAHYLENTRGVQLMKARRAFEDGRYQAAVDDFVLVGDENLRAGDRRLLYEARKRHELEP